MTIIEFLEARLAEDRALVTKAMEPDWNGERPTFYGKGTEGAHRDDWGLSTFHVLPDRFLAEVAAKRAIIGEHRHSDDPEGWRDCSECGEVGKVADNPACWTLCQFASVYSDHPDYQPEWAV